MLVTIMRGVPGSGKTWWHERSLKRTQGRRTVVVGANDFFVNEAGEYKYEPDKINEAHGVCLKKFLETVSDNVTGKQSDQNLVVDNTNILAVSVAPYVSICEAFGLKYQIVLMMPDLNAKQLSGYCVHGVPEWKIKAMAYDLIPLPRFWNPEIVVREWK